MYGLIKEQSVIQEFAACDRLKNCPIYKMRQYINELFARGSAADEGVVFGT